MLTSKTFGSASLGTVPMLVGVNLKSDHKLRHQLESFSSSAWMPEILSLRLVSAHFISETTEDLQ
jgi:hypothetical protein